MTVIVKALKRAIQPELLEDAMWLLAIRKVPHRLREATAILFIVVHLAMVTKTDQSSMFEPIASSTISTASRARRKNANMMG